MSEVEALERQKALPDELVMKTKVGEDGQGVPKNTNFLGLGAYLPVFWG